ncbi:hypothetical protein N7523_008103 [Penicillium sp. IBT 18751x]|nr:hypothetical protein N7523_008103 [Penicillium sp. IBT 18751x]
MFSTFSANLDTLKCPTGATAAPSRRKRAQVARACDWCRLNRIKCDERKPCQNCREYVIPGTLKSVHCLPRIGKHALTYPWTLVWPPPTWIFPVALLRP